eukprot:s1033_g20.t1
MEAAEEEFQFVPDIQEPVVSVCISDSPEDSHSGSSDSATSSAPSSEAEELVSEDNTFAIDGNLYTSARGASIRKTAFVATHAEVKWPCHKLACRKFLDRLF